MIYTIGKEIEMADKIITQQKAIIGYLTKYSRKGITAFEAFEKLHITKLATRISELKQQGYEFIQVWETSKTTDTRFYRYYLKKSIQRGE